jgi:hypothetical protein
VCCDIKIKLVFFFFKKKKLKKLECFVNKVVFVNVFIFLFLSKKEKRFIKLAPLREITTIIT